MKGKDLVHWEQRGGGKGGVRVGARERGAERKGIPSFLPSLHTRAVKGEEVLQLERGRRR